MLERYTLQMADLPERYTLQMAKLMHQYSQHTFSQLFATFSLLFSQCMSDLPKKRLKTNKFMSKFSTAQSQKLFEYQRPKI